MARLSSRPRICQWIIHPTSPTHCCAGFRMPCSAFSHPYLPNPNWFLFHPLLECFNSRGICVFRRAALPQDHRMPAPTLSFSQLAAGPCFTRAKPSTDWRNMHILFVHCALSGAQQTELIFVSISRSLHTREIPANSEAFMECAFCFRKMHQTSSVARC